IQEDIKTAMRAKDVTRLSVLRMVLSDIKYGQAKVNLQTELAESDVLVIVSGYQKKLIKSLEDYPPGEKRDALLGEIRIVGEYLPKKATEEETAGAIAKVLAASTERNFGAVMKMVMVELGDAGDGRLVSQILKAKLA
ncbi:MAG: GatB/YqeY domain-containing protein, partial [Proteobacteria bacterium]|nr:GatB/YqeY domain-containing protein [Pseudomonadota bacterium]